MTAAATSEDIHIERKDANQLDTIIRKLPAENPDCLALVSISFLEAYATSYRYGTPTGRIPATPPLDRIGQALDAIDALVTALRTHHGVTGKPDATASNPAPRR